MQGIVHPSKFYGALAAGRPVLFVGNTESVLAKVVLEHRIGWVVAHGDCDGMRRMLDGIAGMPEAELRGMGERALSVHRNRFDPGATRAAFAEAAVGKPRLHEGT